MEGRPHHFAGGAGTPIDPYQIATIEQLISIGADPNLLDKHFILLNDIDLDPNLPGGRIFTKAVIAPDAYHDPYVDKGWFMGCFDGRGHRIRNLTIRGGMSWNLSLFGGVGEEGAVMDLGVDDAQVGEQSGYCRSALVAMTQGALFGVMPRLISLVGKE